MTGPSPITEEVSNSKVAALFPTELIAQEQARRITQALGLHNAQVVVITPQDPNPGRKLEPENHGIFRTMLMAHLRLGVVGGLVGLVVFAALWAASIRFIVNSPYLSAGALLFFGAVAGLFLGGLVTLRPDHDPYVFKVLQALRQGESALVIHTYSGTQRQEAVQWLQLAGIEPIATL